MRALIIGGSGFVGTALAAHLRSAGDEVIISDRLSGGPDVTDRVATLEHVGSARPDVVYHLAAQAHVPTSWADPIATIRTNVEGTQNVLDAAWEASVERTLVVSSAEVYGSVDPADLPIDETAPLRPTSPYAASKVAADALALQAFLGRGQQTIRLRSFNHFGPGQRPDFVCSALAHRIAEAERTGVTQIETGSLDSRRDFTDVRDVVRAYRLAAVDGDAGEVYNVCSGVDRSIGEVATALVDLATTPMTLVPSHELARSVDTPVVRGDHTKLSERTGWQPTIPFLQTLRDILDEARST